MANLKSFKLTRKELGLLSEILYIRGFGEERNNIRAAGI